MNYRTGKTTKLTAFFNLQQEIMMGAATNIFGWYCTVVLVGQWTPKQDESHMSWYRYAQIRSFANDTCYLYDALAAFEGHLSHHPWPTNRGSWHPSQSHYSSSGIRPILRIGTSLGCESKVTYFSCWLIFNDGIIGFPSLAPSFPCWTSRCWVWDGKLQRPSLQV